MSTEQHDHSRDTKRWGDCFYEPNTAKSNLASPAPSVGELEWETRKDRRTIARIKSGPWSVVDYPSGGCWLRFCGASVKFCESESAAKSLANSLQRILSGAAE